MNSSQALRIQLSAKAETWALLNGIPHYKSLGENPVVLFEGLQQSAGPGNFHPLPWEKIQSNSECADRLRKPHQRKNALPENRRATAFEMDSCNSSDALLMNIFCFPGIIEQISSGISIPLDGSEPKFGIRPGVPLESGKMDTTEIDMVINGNFFEAKLTEQSFTTCSKEKLFTYKHVLKVFDLDKLPNDGMNFTSYQLIRNILAAHHHESWFTVLIDGRRPDLNKVFEQTKSAIMVPELIRRISLITWQQISNSGPGVLRNFLAEKYAI